MVLGRFGRPQTRYAEADHGYLGYQVIGEGDRDIMFLTGALSNADAIWDEPSVESGGILASGTVKDLVVGSGIEFLPYGTFDLKAVPGSWQLYQLKVA